MAYRLTLVIETSCSIIDSLIYNGVPVRADAKDSETSHNQGLYRVEEQLPSVGTVLAKGITVKMRGLP